MLKRVSAQCNKANHVNSYEVLLKVDIQSGKVLADNMARLEPWEVVEEKRDIFKKSEGKRKN